MPQRPTKTDVQVTISLRVPAELKSRLEERAAANHRNLSQEAERALEHSFKPDSMIVDALSLLRPDVHSAVKKLIKENAKG